MENKYIWVLLRIEETYTVFAELGDSAIARIAEDVFEELVDDDDDEAPKSVSEVADLIREDILTHGLDDVQYSVYTLKRVPLNTIENSDITLDDSDFTLQKGASVFEAAEEKVEGCGMDYTVLPVGFFTKPIDHPNLMGLKWIERVLE
ncbi:MAG: hypothetical protein NC339_06760 [Muribaculaceae bacterium]|nr:hypothetical protein [Muribaculaceae bacterium]